MNDDHSRTESADDSAPQTENTAGIPEPSGEEPENDAGTTTDGDAPEPTAEKPDDAPESPEPPEPETPKKRRRPGKKRIPVGVRVILTIFIILALIIGGAAAFASVPVYIELGDEPSLGVFGKNGMLGAVCEPETDISALDTSTLSRNQVPVRFFGFLPWKLNVVVRDTTPPEVTARQISVMNGMEPDPSEFVLSCADMTPVTFEFASAPDFSTDGEHTATLSASDTSGNKTDVTVNYTVTSETAGLRYELGTTADEMLSDLKAKFPDIGEVTVDSLDDTVCGDYISRAENDGVLSLFRITISDTLPPDATAKDTELVVGDVIEAASFLSALTDQSEVSVTTDEAIDFDTPGSGTAKLRATDAWGNSTDIESAYHIHTAVRDVTIEAGTTADQLTAMLFPEPDEGLPTPTPENPDMVPRLPVGENTVMYVCELDKIPFTVNVIDTVPPVLEVKDTKLTKGVAADPSAFVVSCADATDVTFSFETMPDTSVIGESVVTIIATDGGGNRTSATAKLTVIYDTIPPVISGVKDLYSYEGDTIAYRAGVSAVDETDGKVSFYVDTSAVKPYTAGKYRITYTAVDSHGNRAVETATVTVRKVTKEVLDAKADEILKDILTAGMTDREKAKAIYDWCCENLKYSTVTSYLMGNYIKSAYSGYRLHYGNCYTYYAVARSLLSRAGITNMMIQRNDPNKPHYWNLVKIGGSWYHFDTCPQPAPDNDGCFLLTDAEVAAYSKNKHKGYYSFNRAYYPATP